MSRNGLMTLASISTVALSLFILGVFTCGVVNLNNLASNLENQVELSVYMKDGLTTQQTMEVGKKIKALPDIRKLEFINKAEAMKRFLNEPALIEKMGQASLEIARNKYDVNIINDFMLNKLKI